MDPQRSTHFKTLKLLQILFEVVLLVANQCPVSRGSKMVLK